MPCKDWRQPPPWAFSSRSGLFVPGETFHRSANGLPATLQTTEVHPPVPNEWLEQFALSVADADVLTQDPDGDGFNDLEECQGHTNPTEKNSHPRLSHQTQNEGVHAGPFRLVFASSWKHLCNQHDRPEGADAIPENRETPMPDTQFKWCNSPKSTVKKHIRKAKATSPNCQLENQETTSRDPVNEQMVISPESVATFIICGRERREFAIKKDQEFSLTPRTNQLQTDRRAARESCHRQHAKTRRPDRDRFACPVKHYDAKITLPFGGNSRGSGRRLISS